MILRLSLDLPEESTYIRTARLLSRCLLEDIKVIHDTIDDVELIVAELCSNVIRHAESEATRFEVVLEYYQPKVVITVTDTGKGFVPEGMLPVGTPRSDGKGGERLGGFGMLLLAGLSDRVDFTATIPHGTTVCVEKNLLYETQKDADEADERDNDVGGSVTMRKG